jgi:hypothetical protein
MCTSRSISPTRIEGNVGVITTLFPWCRVRAQHRRHCGPPVMYRFVLMELMGKGIPEGNIYLRWNGA